MSSPLNLGLVGVAFATIGGMVYGGYELLKNEDRPMSQLLEIRKRVPLKKDSDPEIWLQNWGEYIKAHTKTKTEEVKVKPEPKSPDEPKTKTVKKDVIDEDDAWNLIEGTDISQVKKDVVPQEFKDRCDAESSKKHSGIWTTEYKNFEKYCTKPDPEED